MIEVDSLTKRYRSGAVVDRVSFSVETGSVLSLLGGSGSGKTTTLKMINRLIEPTSGAVRLDGQDVSGVPAHHLRRQIGYVFQRIGLFPHLTVAENIGVTPSLLGWPVAKTQQRVDALLSLVELDPAEMRDRYPEELSGGQQQRVGVARALAARPRLVLMDEPFGALDPITRDKLQQFFCRIRKETGLTSIFVTHDMFEAMRVGDRIAVLEKGRLVQVGTPAELAHEPANDYVRELMSAPRRQAELFESMTVER